MILIDTSSLKFLLCFQYLIIFQIIFKIPYILILRGGNLENNLKFSRIFSNILFSSYSRLIAPSIFLKYVFKKYGYSVEVLPTPIHDDFLGLNPNKLFSLKFYGSGNSIAFITLKWL